ncbi:MAG: TonB-dependent receptor [Pseudoxanthomonas suwonensis]|nr:TonB-dependent receptor [Pseudoxanthomonas suwonensis]
MQAGGALAQQTTTNDDEQQPAQGSQQEADLERVTVVGSRIRRSEVEGPAPVTVITRADIEREGFQTVGDMLQTLTQNTTASFTGDLGVTGFTPNAQVVNLRALGPGYTLTLVNGRRPAQYPQPYNRDNNVTNVRAIPSGMVERVEVLAGGASAIYGSDAVAGVVNIVLRENFDGTMIRGSAGVTAAGGGNRGKLELVQGRSGDRWNWVGGIQFEALEPVFGTQRDFMADTRDNPYGLTVNPSLSLIAIRQSASPAGPTGHNAVYDAAACDAFGYTTVTTAARGQYCGSYSQNASRSIVNGFRSISGATYGTFDINDNLQAFASLSAYTSHSKAGSGTEFWGTSGSRFTPNGVYFDPNLGHLVQLQRVFNSFELGGNEAATSMFDETTYDITAGISGSVGRFDWEGFVQHSQYDYKVDRPRLLAQAVHEYFLGQSQGAIAGYPIHELNLERWNTPITPDIYRSFSTRVVNEGVTKSSTAAFVINGDLFELPAGPLSFAGTVEAMRQSTDLDSDPRTNPLRPLDNQTVYNLVSSGRTVGSRDRYAAGIEFRVPILNSLSAQLAARYDKYDDITAVDDAITYNLGLEWRPFSTLLLRSSYATSFKAPDMQLVYAEGAASYSTILDEYSCRSGTGPGATAGPRNRAQCNVAGDQTIYSAQSRIAGNPGLKEEEGESFTAGFVWDITPSMSATVDYYRIKLEDRAISLSADYILRAEAACRLGSWSSTNPQPLTPEFCANITSFVTRLDAPGTALDGRVDSLNTAYINAALTDTSGIDANWRYRLDTDRAGRFVFDIGYTLLLTDKYKRFEVDPLIDYRDDTGTAQRSRVRGTIGWEGDVWRAAVFGTRLGSTGSYAEAEGCHSAPNQDICYGRRIKPWMVYNLTVGRKFGPNLTTQFDIVNVLDNKFRYDTSAPWPYYYAWTGADPQGRRFNFSVSYRF